MNKRLFLMGVALATCLLPVTSLRGQFEESVKWVPASANAIVLVRSKDILESQIAEKENWASERRRSYHAGSALLPPDTDRLLLAAQIDFQVLSPIWQVSVFESTKALDIVKVSETVKGSIDPIAGQDAVALPSNAYLVKVSDKMLVSMSPADRQMTARWLQSQAASPIRLSPYLQDAVRYADNNAHVSVAFDLKDVVGADRIRERLTESKMFPEDQIEPLVETITKIKGLKFGITINDKITGAIRVEFDGDATVLADKAKDILLYALRQNGMMIDDFADWPVEVKANEIQLRGPMSNIGLRQVASLIESPLSSDVASRYSELDQPDMKTRTMQYFRAVTEYTDSIRNKDAKALGTYAKWMEKYARQIDNLSVLNVDPDMVEYGNYVANTFRDVSGILLGAEYDKINDRFQYRDDHVYSGVQYNGYWNRYYGYYYQNPQNRRDRQIVGARDTKKGFDDAKEVLREVDAETAKIRQSMSQKYNIDF